MTGTNRRPPLDRVVVGLAVAVVGLAAVSFRLATSLADVRSEGRQAVRAAERRAAAAAIRAASLERTTQEQGVRVASLEARLDGLRDPAEVAASVRPSVVFVSSGEGGLGGGLGTGFVLRSAEGGSIVVTNYHVVAEQWEVQIRAVTVHHGDEASLGTVANAWEADDLAVITVPRALPPLTRAAVAPKVGDRVLVAGLGAKRSWSVSSAVVSSLQAEDGVEYIRFSAPIAPDERNGDDVDGGGVVLDGDGHVVGVVTTRPGAEKDAGLWSAVPIARVCATVGAC